MSIWAPPGAALRAVIDRHSPIGRPLRRRGQGYRPFRRLGLGKLAFRHRLDHGGRRGARHRGVAHLPAGADPFAPVTASAWLGGAYYLLRDYARARTLLADCVARMPNARFAHAFLAATHVQLGDLDRARAEVAEVLCIEPRFTLGG